MQDAEVTRGQGSEAVNPLERIFVAMAKPTPWNMARATYAHCRMHGLSWLKAMSAAIEAYWRERL